MIDHICIGIKNLDKSRKFWTAIMTALDYEVVTDINGWVGFGQDGRVSLWLTQTKIPHEPLHIALQAKTRRQVRAFYEAAIKAGGRDNGAPGIRSIHHQYYYAAFVLDPDGHNIEAVVHTDTE